MVARKHIVITGTGRAGTTFLVELFTALGMETGFTLATLRERKDKISHAALENDLRRENAPYIVKDPFFCEYANEVLKSPLFHINHIIIPVRDLYSVAESRRRVEKANLARMKLLEKVKQTLRPRAFRGGLWGVKDPRAGAQEAQSARQFYQLMYALADAPTNVILMRFPRLATDPNYAYEKLADVLEEPDKMAFVTAFDRVARPDLISKFS